MTFAMTHTVKFQPQYRGIDRSKATKTFPVFRRSAFTGTASPIFPVEVSGRESPERSPGAWTGNNGADYL